VCNSTHTHRGTPFYRFPRASLTMLSYIHHTETKNNRITLKDKKTLVFLGCVTEAHMCNHTNILNIF